MNLFHAIDCDGSESLTSAEVVLFLKSITEDISEENVQKIFTGIDTSGDGEIDFDAFKVKKIMYKLIYFWLILLKECYG